MAVPMFPVRSSRITFIGWEDGTLYVSFTKGATYKYSAVSKDAFDEMLASDSVGVYFEHNIKGHYNSEEV